MCSSTVEICIKAPLFYSLILGKPNQLENASLIDTPNLGGACYTLSADEKYLVFNRDDFTIPIEMQLSQKQETFSRFFAVFLKSRIHFQYFEKDGDPHRFCYFEITESKNVVR